eukprot:2945544-Amphidinium_carterae.1
MTELQIRFGRQACLLAIVSMQQSVSGAALVDGCPDLMLHYLPANAYGTAAASNEATYGRAVEDSEKQYPPNRTTANPTNWTIVL